ncbi:autotransporter outer membrane beta-barrel domain-containing protein, partial [Xanthobacter agilis]|uniref:autotransporter outer membrane beta-barrel domain-containing protein n=1 Tax=Xanthobacter agilis TaxID=47492 RepID=UPI0037279BDA
AGGTITGAVTVASGGVLSGSLTVVGNYTQSSGSTYEVQLGANSSSDLIAVEGSATIAGTVVVTAVTGSYTVGTRYTILTAAGGVSGTYDNTSDTALSYFAAARLNYDDTTAYLDVYQARSFVSAAVTLNQAATATALNTLASGNEIFSTILALQSAETAADAFDALSGEVYASANTVIQQQSIYVRDVVSARLRQSVTEPGSKPLAYASVGPATAQLGAGLTPTLWAQGYGGWGNTFGNGNAASLSNTIGGFLIGADVAVADNARAGVFGGFSRSSFDVNARTSSGTMDNYDVGVYAGAQFGAVAARGGLAYAWHDISVDRIISFSDFLQAASGEYSTGSVQTFGELGYSTKLGSFDVEPFVGLAYLNIAGAAFRESGGSAALSVNVGSMDTTYTTLGVRGGTSVDLYGHALTPSVALGWQHAFGDTSPTASMLFSGGTLPFQVSGVPIAEDTFLLEAGLGYALSDQAALSVSYSGQFADTATQNAFSARFSMKF